MGSIGIVFGFDLKSIRPTISGNRQKGLARGIVAGQHGSVKAASYAALILRSSTVSSSRPKVSINVDPNAFSSARCSYILVTALLRRANSVSLTRSRSVAASAWGSNPASTSELKNPI